MSTHENAKGRCPVDFDHYSADHAKNWVSDFEKLRNSCPMAWTENHGGFWLATRYKDIVRIAQDKEGFQTGKTFDPETGEAKGGINLPSQPIMRIIPLESDPPEWHGFRRLLNDKFGPGAIEVYRPMIRQFAKWALDQVIETGRMELIHDFTGPVPALTTMHILGVPLKHWREFADPFHEMVFWPRNDPEWPNKVTAFGWVLDLVKDLIVARRKDPQDDLISFLAGATVDGKVLNDQTVLEIVYNVIGGGIDTTTNLTAHVLTYLSGKPEEQARLRDDPRALRLATEEFVRFYSPVHALARTAAKDTEFDDATIEAGDRVLLAFSAANRDPDVFDRPDELKLDRFPNRHIGFGAGLHRCLGSFLARAMFEAMLHEVFERIPDFKVIADEAVPYPAIGSVNGWISVPMTFTPGPRSGVELAA